MHKLAVDEFVCYFDNNGFICSLCLLIIYLVLSVVVLIIMSIFFPCTILIYSHKEIILTFFVSFNNNNKMYKCVAVLKFTLRAITWIHE